MIAPAGHSGRSPKRSKGWLTDIGAVPFPLRGDADGLPQWAYQSAMTQDELDSELKLFMDRCGAHEVAEERRLAYVAATRARDSLLLTGAVWGDGSTPREPSRFLEEIRELAEGGPFSDGAEFDGQIRVGHWVDVPGEGAENPRAVDGRTASWPDPLEGRRDAVESGAGLVSAAMQELSRQFTGLQPDERLHAELAQTSEPVQTAGTAEIVELAQTAGSAETAEPAQTAVSAEEAAWAREVELLIQERDTNRSGEVTVRLPVHLSASRVVTLVADPEALAERLRRPMPEQPSPQARRGSEFHAWLERRFGAAALVDVDELPGAGDDIEDDETQALTALQDRFLASEWASRTAEAVEVAIETPIAGVVLRGRIDAVFARPGGGWDVVDWKTGRPPGPERARALAVQLAVYRIAWARLHQVPVEQVSAAFFYASTGQTVRPVDLLAEPELEELLTLSS